MKSEKKGWGQQVKNQKCKKKVIISLFSLESLQKIKISFCFNRLP